MPTMFEEIKKSNINLFLSLLHSLSPSASLSLSLNTYIYMCAHFFGNYFFFAFCEKKRIITFKRQRLPPDVFCQTSGILK